MPVICYMECGKELTFSDFMERNVISLKDIDFKKVGIFCREHGEQVKLKLEEAGKIKLVIIIIQMMSVSIIV